MNADDATRPSEPRRRPPDAASTLTRHEFLRSVAPALSGAGAALLAGATTAVPALAATPGAAGAPAIVPGPRFPIGLWWPPPPFETTLERYREIVEAGFTFTHSNDYLYADHDIQEYALGFADQVGLQLLIDDPRIRWLLHEFRITGAGGDFTRTPQQATITIRQVLDTYQLRSFWKIQDGHLLMDGGTGDGSIGLSRQGATWTDYTFAFDTAPLPTGGNGSSQAGFAFRAQDQQNAYVWLLSNGPYTSPRAPGYLVRVLFVKGSPVYVTPVPLTFAVTGGTWYHVEIAVSGSSITTSINGQVVDTTTDSTYAQGKVGFREAGTESALFAKVKVTAAGKVLLADDFSNGLGQWDPPIISGHASFAGLDLYDEPGDDSFESLAAAVAIVRSLNSDALPFINLLPDFDGGAGYAKFAAAVKPAQLSFDRYPILARAVEDDFPPTPALPREGGGSSEDTGYFKNWSDVRAAALQANLPAWTFIQSVGYNGHAVPTAPDLLWQINISLAYGCKGIQYFTYWTPDPARGEGFTSALLTVDGRRTPLYYAAKEINNQYLAPLGKVLLPLVSESVQAANLAAPPQGLPAFAPDAYVAATRGDAVVLGRFTAGGADPTRWVLVANFSRHEPASVTLTFGPAAGGVDRFEPAGARYKQVGKGDLHLNLAPGAAQLLRLRS